jgi:hypothetical protein
MMELQLRRVIGLPVFRKNSLQPTYGVVEPAGNLFLADIVFDHNFLVEALRIFGAAMMEAGVAGIGRLTLSRRERIMMIKPRGPGMARK